MFIDAMIMRHYAEQMHVRTWVPDATYVVMGSANSAAREVHQNYCDQNSITVLRRAGGGGTVVLYPGCVIIGMCTWVAQQFNNAEYFRLINQAVIQALSAELEGHKFVQNGFSDITTKEGRKIAGTSLFRSKNFLLYQASIIVHLDLDLVNACLPHPSREPAYRARKSHKDFLIGLDAIKPGISAALLSEKIGSRMKQELESTLAGELVAPQPEQFKYIERRLQNE